jgi:YD repeat-containing protein
VIEETQRIGGLASRAISSAWRAANLRSALFYPNGRTVQYTYDGLDRLNTVTDQGAAQAIANYDCIGKARVARRSDPINGTRLTYLNNSSTADVGYDGLRRPIQLRHLRADNSVVVGFTHTF